MGQWDLSPLQCQWPSFRCILESGQVIFGPAAQGEAAMVVSGRMRRWLVLVAVAAVLPLVGGVAGHSLGGSHGASRAVVMFGCLALAVLAWYASRGQEQERGDPI